MALDRRLLDLLYCPVHKKPLRLAAVDEIAQLAAHPGIGQWLEGAEGAPLGGLIEPSSRTCYPIVDDIPVLLPEAGVVLPSPSGMSASLANPDAAGRG